MNAKLGIALCIVLPTIGTFPVAAADWVTVGADEAGRTWSVDRSALQRNGDIVIAPRKVDFATPDPYPPTGQLIARAEFVEVTHCARSTTGVWKSKLTAADGSVIAEHEDPIEKIQWQSAASGSFLETSIRKICALASEQ